MQDFETRGAGQLPRFAGIFTAVDTLFTARQQDTRSLPVDADRFREFAMERAADFLPCAAIVAAHPDAMAVAEVDCAGGVAIDSHVAHFSDIAARQNCPLVA